MILFDFRTYLLGFKHKNGLVPFVQKLWVVVLISIGISKHTLEKDRFHVNSVHMLLKGNLAYMGMLNQNIQNFTNLGLLKLNLEHWQIKVWRKYFWNLIFSFDFLWFQNLPVRIAAQKWACPICAIVMKCSAHIKRHVRLHTDEKPFACKFCPYAAKMKASLQKHVATKHSESYKAWFIEFES